MSSKGSMINRSLYRAIRPGMTANPVLIGVVHGLEDLYGPIIQEQPPERMLRLACAVDSDMPRRAPAAGLH